MARVLSKTGRLYRCPDWKASPAPHFKLYLMYILVLIMSTGAPRNSSSSRDCELQTPPESHRWDLCI
jgi:hypothetical protein